MNSEEYQDRRYVREVTLQHPTSSLLLICAVSQINTSISVWPFHLWHAKPDSTSPARSVLPYVSWLYPAFKTKKMTKQNIPKKYPTRCARMLMAKYIHSLFNNPSCIIATSKLLLRCLTYIIWAANSPWKKENEWKMRSPRWGLRNVVPLESVSVLKYPLNKCNYLQIVGLASELAGHAPESAWVAHWCWRTSKGTLSNL